MGNLHRQTPARGVVMFSLLNWPRLSSQQDGEPVSKNAEKILEKGQEALDERTGAVEQHKVRGGAGRQDKNIVLNIVLVAA